MDRGSGGPELFAAAIMSNSTSRGTRLHGFDALGSVSKKSSQLAGFPHRVRLVNNPVAIRADNSEVNQAGLPLP